MTTNYGCSTSRLPTEGGGPPLPDARTDAATINAGTEIVRVVRQFEDVARAFYFTQQGLSLMGDSVADRSLLEQQMRRMQERLVEMQEEIDKLSPTFEIEEKPR
jgi:hypothetical protein